MAQQALTLVILNQVLAGLASGTPPRMLLGEHRSVFCTRVPILPFLLSYNRGDSMEAGAVYSSTRHRDFHIMNIQGASEKWPKRTEILTWVSGLSLTFGSLSLDVDECSMAYSPCDQLCHNTPGSYSCGCIQGYQLSNGTSCRVIGEFHYPKQSLSPAPFLAVIIGKSDTEGSL